MDLTQVSSSSSSSPSRPNRAFASETLNVAQYDERPFLKRLGVVDWLFAVVMVAGAGFALSRYHPFMNYYDKLVLCLAVPVFVVLGWRWKPVRPLMAGIAALSLLAIQIYHGDLTRADSAFFLKYFLSSQSAILCVDCGYNIMGF